MTGLLDGLRAWLGSFVGDGTDDDETDDGNGESSTVVRRDDRPLETPSDLDPAPPSEADALSTRSGPSPPTDVVGDASGVGGDDGDDGRPERVSIPDAESAVDGPTPGRPVTDDSPPTTPDEGSDPDDDGLVCSVCGTAVDDPTEACPLCGSTDVQSTEAGDDSLGSSPGRTTTSTADDEAVDRLGDVRGDDDNGGTDTGGR
jgi:hypothetical protein